MAVVVVLANEAAVAWAVSTLDLHVAVLPGWDNVHVDPLVRRLQLLTSELVELCVAVVVAVHVVVLQLFGELPEAEAVVGAVVVAVRML